jgi:hypothetical protein
METIALQHALPGQQIEITRGNCEEVGGYVNDIS